MGVVSVISAGLASWIFGAVWYGAMSKAWMQASGVAIGDDGRPANAKSPAPYIISLVSALLVAGMMRHAFALSGIETVAASAVSGFGIGAFWATPWIATNNGFAGRPWRLTAIDGVYVTGGCTVMGVVLGLF